MGHIVRRLQADQSRNHGYIPVRDKRIFYFPKCLDWRWGWRSLLSMYEGHFPSTWSWPLSPIQCYSYRIFPLLGQSLSQMAWILSVSSRSVLFSAWISSVRIWSASCDLYHFYVLSHICHPWLHPESEQSLALCSPSLFITCCLSALAVTFSTCWILQNRTTSAHSTCTHNVLLTLLTLMTLYKNLTMLCQCERFTGTHQCWKSHMNYDNA